MCTVAGDSATQNDCANNPGRRVMSIFQPLQYLRDPDWRSTFFCGVQDILGAVLGTVAMGLVTGVAMAKSDIGLGLILAISLLVFASSSQLACLPLIGTGAPIWVIALTACMLNLRFIIFSAHWRRYFGGHRRSIRMVLSYLAGDPIYAQFVQRFPVASPNGNATAEQLGYFLGLSLTNWGAWQISSLAGIFLADVIPTEWGLRFVGVLALMTLALPMLTDTSVRLSALTAACVAVALAALPLGLNVIAAIASAFAVGIWIDKHWG